MPDPVRYSRHYMRMLLVLLVKAYLPAAEIAYDEKAQWITINGAHVKTDEGDLQGPLGNKIEASAQTKLSKRQRKEEHNKKSVAEFYGEEIKGENLKGDRAVARLLMEGKGHIKSAFHRDDLGDIDLCWGDTEAGLLHIVYRRMKKGEDWRKVMKTMAEVIEKGSLEPDREDKMNHSILYNGVRVVVSKSFKDDGNIRLVVSGYEPKKDKK